MQQELAAILGDDNRDGFVGRRATVFLTHGGSRIAGCPLQFAGAEVEVALGG